MKMTIPAIAKLMGIATGAALATAGTLYATGRSGEVRGSAFVQPVISAPVVTTADLAALRVHIDQRFNAIEAGQHALEAGQRTLDERLSRLEGYVAGAEKRK